MSLVAEVIGSAPIAEELPGVRVRQEDLACFALSLPRVPVCNFIDLKETGLYSTNPEAYEKSYGRRGSQSGQSYAWKRLPRFMDDFKRIRDELRYRYPGELIMGIDLGSSFPIYSELMRSISLRKSGSFGSAIVAESVNGFMEHGESLGLSSKEVGAFVASHGAQGSEFRRALASALQLALYTIPEEMSGELSEIEAYLESVVAQYLLSATKHVDRLDRKDHKNLGALSTRMDMVLEPVLRSPMERAWRIDSFFDTFSGRTAYELVSDTLYQDLSVEAGTELSVLFGLVKIAKAEGDDKLAEELRGEAINLKRREGKLKYIGDEVGANIVSWFVKAASKIAIDQRYAYPTKFVSVDNRDPQEILEEAKSSFDIETLISGLYRRTAERLRQRDPLHIHADIADVVDWHEPDSIASITSIESWPFYVPHPERLRDVHSTAADVANKMASLVEKLKVGGQYMTFPWGPTPFMGSGEEVPAARVARQALIPQVGKLLLPLTIGGGVSILRQDYATAEVTSWMTQGEFSELAGRSPAFTRTNSEDGFEVLRLRREKPRPSTARPLLSPRQ